MTAVSPRPIPRPFKFPWGAGQIIEEASYRGQHHEPVIQLLEFEDGTRIVRFCSYTLRGQFERNSWLAGEDELEHLGGALEHCPLLSALLRALVR